MVRVTTDVGGTFTDLVYFATDPKTGDQSVRTAKSDTTPPNFEQGVLDVIAKADVDVAGIGYLAHGTTVVINALTERKGAAIGLITTEGFRDVLEIARGNRPDLFNLGYVKPAPFVPRHLRREVPGRLDHHGDERVPLDLSGLPQVIDDFKAQNVEAIAICLLHSYADDGHERDVMTEVQRLWPEVAVVASHQITREWREYERTNTAVLSAYVQPIAERYLSRLEDGLRSREFDGRLYIMQSNCGVDTLEHAKKIPITMVESGPASGFWGAAEIGRIIGEPNVLALDIGGTTAKCSLIEDGLVAIKTDYWIERDRTSAGYPIMVPVVDLVEIGNGGGSIAWVDDFGKMHVGPQSAGATPGPASYGRGGDNATTTDANLALGRINKDFFCGGEVKADLGAMNAALDRLGERLDIERAAVARGIVRIANNNMVNALKLVSLNRGHDPRDFVLVAFGGGGAMHAVSLGLELGVKKVVIPRGAGVFSAWGMMMSDLRRDYFVTQLIELEDTAAEALESLFGEIESQALEQFLSEDVNAEDVRFVRYGKFRYQNQEHAIEVVLPHRPVTKEAIDDIAELFAAAYEREYTYRLDAPVEVVGAHVVAFAEIGKLEMTPLPTTGRTLDGAYKGRRLVDYALEGVHEADIYDNALLEPGMSFTGPAVVEDRETTIVIHPGNAVHMDAYGNLHIETNTPSGS